MGDPLSDILITAVLSEYYNALALKILSIAYKIQAVLVFVFAELTFQMKLILKAYISQENSWPFSELFCIDKLFRVVILLHVCSFWTLIVLLSQKSCNCFSGCCVSGVHHINGSC